MKLNLFLCLFMIPQWQNRVSHPNDKDMLFRHAFQMNSTKCFADLLPKLGNKDTPAWLVFPSFVSKSTRERKNYIHISAHNLLTWRSSSSYSKVWRVEMLVTSMRLSSIFDTIFQISIFSHVYESRELCWKIRTKCLVSTFCIHRVLYLLPLVFQPSPPWPPCRPQPAGPRSDQPRPAAGGSTANASANQPSEPWSCRAAGERTSPRA